ncbi:MAG: hypothetical protein KKB20_10170 [Proteobacteria bacterium]|nr:hypothetical protein [Pseudomonadota bacterium]
MNADQEPLYDVVKKIGQMAGYQISLDQKWWDASVSTILKDVPLEQGLRYVVRAAGATSYCLVVNDKTKSLEIIIMDGAPLQQASVDSKGGQPEGKVKPRPLPVGKQASKEPNSLERPMTEEEFKAHQARLFEFGRGRGIALPMKNEEFMAQQPDPSEIADGADMRRPMTQEEFVAQQPDPSEIADGADMRRPMTQEEFVAQQPAPSEIADGTDMSRPMTQEDFVAQHPPAHSKTNGNKN